jgi:hypothetical protein
VEKSNKRNEINGPRSCDEAVLENWIRCTKWALVFTGVNRRLVVRLAEAPSADGSPSSYREFEGQKLQSSAGDERGTRPVGAAIDSFFDRCENTIRYTDQSIITLKPD